MLEHARKRENEQTKRPTFSTVTAPRSSPETGPNRPRPPPWLCNIMYISIILCMVHRILALVAPKYIQNMHSYYFYSYEGAMGGVFSELFCIVPTYYCLRVASTTTIAILLQLFTYCTQKQN